MSKLNFEEETGFTTRAKKVPTGNFGLEAFLLRKRFVNTSTAAKRLSTIILFAVALMLISLTYLLHFSSGQTTIDEKYYFDPNAPNDDVQ
ncbi:MAG: hypothetical protein ACI9SY_000633 [Candidatus Paceibacteria bacterium]|jgi:hypothetical protein